MIFILVIATTTSTKHVHTFRWRHRFGRQRRMSKLSIQFTRQSWFLEPLSRHLRSGWGATNTRPSAWCRDVTQARNVAGRLATISTPIYGLCVISFMQNITLRVITKACERSGAAKFPAHRSAPFTGVPLTAPFPLRRPPAPLRSFDFLARSPPAPQQGRI